MSGVRANEGMCVYGGGGVVKTCPGLGVMYGISCVLTTISLELVKHLCFRNVVRGPPPR